MAIIALTLKELRQLVSDAVADLRLVTASGAGTTTTVVDNTLLEPDDFWNGSELLAIGGTAGNLGKVREATDWVKSTFTLTLAPALPSATAATDTFELRNLRGRGFKRAEVEAAINQAIREVADFVLAEKNDTSLTVTAATYIYSIPTGFTHLSAVYIKVEDTRWVPVSSAFWRMLPGRKLQLDKYTVADWAGRGIWLQGYQAVTTLAADADSCAVESDWLVAKAAAFLHQRKGKSGPLDADGHGAHADYWEKLAQSLRAKVRTSLPPSTRKVLS